jgi:hypothetical protein
MKKTSIIVLAAASLLSLPAAAADLGVSHRHHRQAHVHRHIAHNPAPAFYGYSRYACGFVRAPGHPVFSGATYVGNTGARRAEALSFGADEASVCGGWRSW